MIGHQTQYQQQTTKLKQVGKMDMGRQKCPNCESRCSGWTNHVTGEYWCYTCGWRTGMKLTPKPEGVKKSTYVKKADRDVVDSFAENNPVGTRRVVITRY